MYNKNPHFREFVALNGGGDMEFIVAEARRHLMKMQAGDDSGDLPPCTDGIGPMTFFNELSVKKALHVNTKIHWGMCNMDVTMKYKRSTTGSYNVYPGLVKEGLRIWIYSGDVDGAVPLSGTLYWFNKLANEKKYEVK